MNLYIIEFINYKSFNFQQEQENISRRTRSKFCLTTTAIETLESTFVPPDITLDMYDDFDQKYEHDNEWKEFLSEFMMPSTSTAEDDDEKSDPEYVAAEPVSMDKDELRPFKVSKRELNQLIAELLEDSADNFNFDQEPSNATKRNSTEFQSNKNKRQKLTPSDNNKPSSPKISSRMYTSEEMLSTPPSRYDSQMPTISAYAPCEVVQEKQQSNVEINSFYQQQMQTPQKFLNLAPLQSFTSPQYLFSSPSTTPFQSPAPVQSFTSPQCLFSSPSSTQLPPQMSFLNEELRLPQITGVYGSPFNITASPSILVRNAQNQLELTSSGNLINQAFCNNGIIQLPQYQQIVVQVPTIDLLQNRLNLSTIIADQSVASNISSSIETIPQDPADDSKAQLIVRKVKLKEFEYLEIEQPEEISFNHDLRGFTYEQKEIYEQQMRMHAQLLSQHYLQLYANPKWWEKSEPIKKNLTELKEAVKPTTSALTAKHIDYCLTMCSDWEKELEVKNVRNKKYAEFLYDEYDSDVKAQEGNYQFKGRFHNRLMEHMLSSKAILYPKLLPKIPFRSVVFQQVEPTNSELRLLALGVERFHDELYRKLNSLKPSKIREPKLSSIARSIIREYKSFRRQDGLIKIIKRYKDLPNMNPIKYYFIHNKAPVFKHDIEEVNKFIAPKNLRRGLLPKNWDAYMFSYKRVSKSLILKINFNGSYNISF